MRDSTLALHMGNYFWLALEARDALIMGSLKRAKSRMQKLSQQEYKPLVPAAWYPDMELMLAEARQVAEARDTQEAAIHLAKVAITCGDCHVKVNAGPLPHAGGGTKPADEGEDVTTRMLRHQWAADSLWSGLTRPSDAEWMAGAEALIDAPLMPPETKEGGVVNQAQHAAMEDVREIGQEAKSAERPVDRAQAYADLVQSCSRCHGGF